MRQSTTTASVEDGESDWEGCVQVCPRLFSLWSTAFLIETIIAASFADMAGPDATTAFAAGLGCALAILASTMNCVETGQISTLCLKQEKSIR